MKYQLCYDVFEPNRSSVAVYLSKLGWSSDNQQ